MLRGGTLKNNYSHKWQAFIGITLLSFGCYLDYTIVNIALPTIQQTLQANLATLQWVMNIYFLSLCVFATIMGRCGDIYGRRRLFYVGVIIFTIASIIAGLALNIHWLIFGRLLQGIGAAIVLPLGPSLLPQSFPEQERAKAIAWLGSMGGVALAIGPVIGGLIISHWNWHWIFFINIPMTLLGFLFCFNSVKESIVLEEKQKLDWSGMLLLMITIGSTVLGLIHSEAFGWGNYKTIFYLIFGLMGGIGLYLLEKSKENPLIDFKDFSKLLFFAASALIFLAGILSAVALFFDPLYLQILRNQSPQLSGLILFVIPVAVFVVAIIVSPLINRLGLINTILLGLSLGVIGSFLHIYFTSMTSIFYIIFAFIILGAQWAIGNTVSIFAAQTAVGPKRASVATGTIVTLFNLGGSIGLAIAVVIYHAVSLSALKNMQQITQYQLNEQTLKMTKQLIASPANSLQIKTDGMLHEAFNYLFMRGFSGVMLFLTLWAGFLLLSVLVWYAFKKSTYLKKIL